MLRGVNGNTVGWRIGACAPRRVPGDTIDWRKGKQHDAQPEGDERRAPATGVGVPEGAPNRRGQSQTRYVRGDNRLGARTQQLRLRRRLQRIIRAAIVHAVGAYKWMDLPAGADSSKLLPVGLQVGAYMQYGIGGVNRWWLVPAAALNSKVPGPSPSSSTEYRCHPAYA